VVKRAGRNSRLTLSTSRLPRNSRDSILIQNNEQGEDIAAPRPTRTPIGDDSSKATGENPEGTAPPAVCELAVARPLPDSILSMADATLRQRATDA
jgi:hypothetical protein